MAVGYDPFGPGGGAEPVTCDSVREAGKGSLKESPRGGWWPKAGRRGALNESKGGDSVEAGGWGGDRGEE